MGRKERRRRLKFIKSVEIVGNIDPISLHDNEYENVDCPKKVSARKFYVIDKKIRDSLWLLQEDVKIVITLKDGRVLEIDISEGLLTDWASVPRAFRWLAPSNDRRVRIASLVHDCLYYDDTHPLTFKEVQLVFRDIIVIYGGSRVFAGRYWAATRFFSRRMYKHDTYLDNIMKPFIRYVTK